MIIQDTILNPANIERVSKNDRHHSSTNISYDLYVNTVSGNRFIYTYMDKVNRDKVFNEIKNSINALTPHT